MSDKRKVKEIVKAISKQKKRVAKNLGKKIEKKEHLFSILVPLFAGLLFLIFSILNLTSSIWFDEAYSSYLIRGDFSQIWEMTAQDVHPPFYYFALKMWSSIFGTSDVALRFMSIFFGLIAIIFIFQAMKKWFGIRPACLATIFAAISPMFIRYGQEMRMYTMVLAIVAIATYVLSLALEKGTDKRGIKFWFLYAVLISIGMWTHYFSAFMWIAHVMVVIVHFGGFKKIFKNKKVIKLLVLTYGFAILTYIPWIPSFFNQVQIVEKGFWIPPISFDVISDFFTSALFFNTAKEVTGWGFVFGVALIVMFILCVVAVWKKASVKLKKALKFMAIIAAVPFFVMTVVSLPPLTSSFVDRYILYSIVALWMMFGVIVVLTKVDWMKNALAALVVIVAAFGITFVENRTPKGYIKEILAETFVAAEKEEPIIANSVWAYYDGIFYSTDEHPIYLFNEDVNYEYGSLEPIRMLRVNLIDNREEFLKDKKTVWYILDSPEDGFEYEIPKWAEKMRIVSEISLGHHTALRFSAE